MNNINKQVSNATKWSIFTEIIIKIISPITNMILARLLTPEAFGVVATVTMIVSFTDIFTDAGFQKYIVQHKFLDGDDEDLSICVAFWTNIIISIILWGIIFAFSNQIAISVGNPGLGKVIYIGALILPMTSFSSIQTAIYRKSLNYKGISYARIIVKIVGELCNAIILTTMSKWKPKFKYSFEKLKTMFLFCGWTLLETISSWLVTNVGIFVIGRLFNQYYLGIYKTGTTMVGQITSLISGATISVLFSALSKLQDDEVEFKNMYYKFLKGIGILVVPLGIGILLYKDVVRSILLGGQWGEADLLIGFWGLILAESVIFNDMSGAIILSKGHPELLFVSNMIQAIIMIPALYISSSYGFKALVIASCIVRVQLPLTQTIIARKVSDIRIVDVIYQLKDYIIASGIMAIIALVMRQFMNTIFLRYLSIIICMIVYAICLCILPESRKEIHKYIMITTNALHIRR